MATDLQAAPPPARAVFYNDPKVRSIAYQIALCVVVGLLVYGAGSNVVTNLQKAKIASGFGFWNDTAGFDISQTLIPFSSAASTYGTAVWAVKPARCSKSSGSVLNEATWPVKYARSRSRAVHSNPSNAHEPSGAGRLNEVTSAQYAPHGEP